MFIAQKNEAMTLKQTRIRGNYQRAAIIIEGPIIT